MDLEKIKEWYADRPASLGPTHSNIYWLVAEVEGLRADVKFAEANYERMLGINAELRAENAKLRGMLIESGCHDILCAESANVCRNCPVYININSPHDPEFPDEFTEQFNEVPA